MWGGGVGGSYLHSGALGTSLGESCRAVEIALYFPRRGCVFVLRAPPLWRDLVGGGGLACNFLVCYSAPEAARLAGLSRCPAASARVFTGEGEGWIEEAETRICSLFFLPGYWVVSSEYRSLRPHAVSGPSGPAE